MRNRKRPLIGTALNSVHDQKNEKVSFISFHRFNDICKLYHYLYDKVDTYMIRKKEKLEGLISEYRDNHVA